MEIFLTNVVFPKKSTYLVVSKTFLKIQLRKPNLLLYTFIYYYKNVLSK